MKKTTLYLLTCLLIILVGGLPLLAAETFPGYEFSVKAKGEKADITGNKAKFNEYGEHNAATVNVSAKRDGNDYAIEFEANNIGTVGQDYLLQVGKLGKFQAYVSYNGIEHRLTDDAKTIFTGAGGGVLNTRTVLTSPATPTNLFDYEINREQTSVGGKFSAYKPFALDISFFNERTTGIKPTAIPTGTGGGSNFVELPEPVNYQTNTVKANAAYNAKPVLLELDMSYSMFSNMNEYLYFNNPLSVASLAQTKSDYVSLPIGNKYGSVSLKGAMLDLPLNSVFNFKIAGGEANSQINLMGYNFWSSGVPTTVTLTSNSFDGKIRTGDYSAVLTSNPINSASFKVFYKHYIKKNLSTQVGQTEAGVNGGNIFYNELFDYIKTSSGIESDIKLPFSLSLTPSYTLLKVSRNREDVPENTDSTLAVFLKWRGASFFTPKIGYEYMRRTAELGALSPLFATDQANFALFEPYIKRFDAAPMTRETYIASLDISPADMINFDLYLKNTKKNYIGREDLWGRRNDDSLEYGASMNWEIMRQLSFNGYFAYEQTKSTQFQRGGTAAATLANPSVNTAAGYSWLSDDKERTSLYGAALEYRAIPNRLTFSAQYDYTDSNGRMDLTFYGGYSPNTGGNVDGLDIYKKTSFSFKTKYELDKNFSLLAGYAFEKYDYSDLAWDNYLYANSAGTVSLTGAGSTPSYSAHIIFGWVKYNF